MMTLDLTGGAAVADVEQERLDLPAQAEQQADGSVLFTFDAPVVLRRAQGDAAVEERVETLLFNRLRGAQMRKLFAAVGRTETLALALCCGLTQARAALVLDKSDAADGMALAGCVAALLGMGDGLPQNAEEIIGEDGRPAILLPLREAVAGPGGRHDHLVFKRLTTGDLMRIGEAKMPVAAGIARSCGMTPKDADALMDEMDGADVMAAQRVIGFLSGSGRKTGR